MSLHYRSNIEGMISMARRRAAAQPAEEVFEEVDELEELDDPEAADDLEELVEEPAPVKRTTKAAKSAPTKAAPAKATKRAAAPAESSSEYDSNWLATHVTEATGVEYDGRGVRMLLRKLAKDGVFEREIGTDRSRYTFAKGANDPIVKKVVAMVKSGAATQVRQEGLETAKTSKAAKATVPAKKAPPAKTAPAKAAPAKTTRRRAAAQ